MNPGSIDQHKLKELLSLALAEDVGDGDHTSLATVSSAAKGIAEVRCKGDGIFAGSVVAPALFNLVDDAVQLRSFVTEGDEVTAGKIAMQVDGSIQSLLKAERILLNCMQRMSGIATFTRKFVTEVAGTNARILDTRKTTPNFRLLEKWAVKAGGGFNHRFGLYDMILIKDNHVDACGGVRNAIEKANAYLQQTGKTLAIEIEIRNLKELNELLETGRVDRILLDNFQPAGLAEAVKLVNGKFETEASGGIHLENVRAYAGTGVDFISVGGLTHSYRSMDISMKIVRVHE